MRKFIQRAKYDESGQAEPVTIGGAISALILAVLGLITAFGGTLSQGQVSAIMGVVGCIVILVTTLASRSKVTPLSNPRDNQGRPLTP